MNIYQEHRRELQRVYEDIAVSRESAGGYSEYRLGGISRLIKQERKDKTMTMETVMDAWWKSQGKQLSTEDIEAFAKAAFSAGWFRCGIVMRERIKEAFEPLPCRDAFHQDEDLT